ncbi:hypothetical protein BJV74DRAFT_113647 [Russula compacta]|nr:hypothetical protein BJV74DRAFT_113647 [Russula compacta]
MTATISKGTLNLRFMQNAQRAERQVETKSAETVIKDESQWEVAKEVKEMWGISSTKAPSSSLVTHEASYLPFVLSRSDASGSPPQQVRLRGRRTWNKRGQEVTEVEIRSSISPQPTAATIPVGHLPPPFGRTLRKQKKDIIIIIITLPRNGLRRYQASDLALPRGKKPS